MLTHQQIALIDNTLLAPLPPTSTNKELGHSVIVTTFSEGCAKPKPFSFPREGIAGVWGIANCFLLDNNQSCTSHALKIFILSISSVSMWRTASLVVPPFFASVTAAAAQSRAKIPTTFDIHPFLSDDEL
jgi:hypothetical protein